MLRIAICEDDKEQQQLIESLIINEEISEPYELNKFNSGEDLIREYEAGQRFSIILLDMQMNELDGIQTAEIIRKYDKGCIIIIVTSVIEYAVDGYSIDAYDFILKPINKDKFVKILRNAVKKIQTDRNKTYVVQMRDKTSVLRLSDIVYIESSGKKVNVCCEKDSYLNNETISCAENKLSVDGFIRISRYYLINVQHIKEIGVKSILLSTGDSLNYSEKYCDSIKKKYMDFMMGDM